VFLYYVFGAIAFGNGDRCALVVGKSDGCIEEAGFFCLSVDWRWVEEADGGCAEGRGR
jgi:hypothetical protein